MDLVPAGTRSSAKKASVNQTHFPNAVREYIITMKRSLWSSLGSITITQESVLKVLLDIDGNSAMGPDEIHPLLLKKCAEQLAYPLTIIFNRSLQDGALPSDWKTSLIVPIFKKGHRYDALNYRPISLTSVPSKVMERILSKSLVPYLETHGLLSPHQFGFRTGRSTMDQLLLVYDSVSKQTDRGAVSDVILFDFSKAFDVVVHNLMIDKLSSIGIQGNILKWITSFLTRRSMRVCVKVRLVSQNLCGVGFLRDPCLAQSSSWYMWIVLPHNWRAITKCLLMI